MSEHHRDDLRVLAAEEVDERARVGVGEERERVRGVGLGEPVDDGGRALGAERRGEQVVGHLDAAAGAGLAGADGFLELAQHGVDDVGLHRAQAHDLGGDLLDLGLAQLRQHRARSARDRAA